MADNSSFSGSDWLRFMANQPSAPFAPIQTAKENTEALMGMPSKIYHGAKQLVTDPKAYFADIKPPSAEEMAMAFNPAHLGAMAGTTKLYSGVNKAASELTRAKGTGKEFMTELTKKPGVKKAELADRNLHEINDLPKMTKEQFQAELDKRPKPQITKKILGKHPDTEQYYTVPEDDEGMSDRHYVMDANHEQVTRHPFDTLADAEEHIRKLQDESSNVHHEDYKLPGGENYQEHLYKHEPEGQEPFVAKKEHFGAEPNVLASARTVDRRTPDGKKILHVEEIQSDWHQRGRDEGYFKPLTYEEGQELNYLKRIPLNALMNNPEAHARFSELAKKTKGVPDAPFKKNWEEMVGKDLVKHAIDNGYDAIALTNGETQADRYNLGKYINELHLSGSDLVGYDHDGNTVIKQTGVTPENLNQYVGKKTAKKLLDQPQQGTLRSLTGEDLYLGEGMKEAYDKRLPNVFNDIGKPYGAEMQLNGMSVLNPKSSNLSISDMLRQTNTPEQTWLDMPFEHKEQMMDDFATAQTNNRTPLHYMEFTPEMKQNIRTDSLPAYADGGQVEHPGFLNPSLKLANGQVTLDPLEFMPNYDVGGVVKSLATPNNISRMTDIPYLGEGVQAAKEGKYGDAIGSVVNTFMPTGAALATYSPELNPNEASDLSKTQYVQGHHGRQQRTWANGMARGGKVHVADDLDMMRHEIHMSEGGDTESVADKVKSTVTDWGHRLANHFVGMASDPVQYAKNLGAQTQEDLQVISDLHNQAFGDPKRPLKITDQNAFNDLASKYMNSVTNFAPMGMTKAVEKELSLPDVLPRATPKTKAEIQKFAQQMSEMMQDKFYRISPEKSINPAGKSLEQWNQEQQLVHDIRPTALRKDLPVSDIAKQKGMVKMGISGDTTSAEQVLHRAGPYTLEYPTQLYGGPLYGLGGEGAWASNNPIAANVQERINEISKAHGGAPVLGQYMAMGKKGSDFAQHFAEANLRAIDTTKMSPQQIEKLNELIRQGSPKSGPRPSFPGIEDKADAYLHFAIDGELRKHFNSIMQKPTYTEPLGLPDGRIIYHAITEPALRDLPVTTTGFSQMQLSPNVKSSDLILSAHPTYSHVIPHEPGSQITRTPYPVPAQLEFPDVTEYFKNLKVNGEQKYPLNETTKLPESMTRLYQTSTPRQIVDQQHIDEIKAYEDFMKQYTGKKKGGEVHMAGGGALVDKIAMKLGQFVVPTAEREANLGKFLAGSQVQDPVYHATYSNFKIPTVNHGNKEYHRFGIHVGTPEAANARVGIKQAEDTAQGVKSGDVAANIMPVHINVKNPLRLDENRTGRWGVDDVMRSIMEKADRGELPQVPPSHVDDYMNDTFHIEDALGIKPTPGDHNYDPNESIRFWSDHHEFEPGERSDLLRHYINQLGHDSIVYNNEFEGGGDSHILLSPNQMKSVTGNQGTYNPESKDIGRRKGGKVHVSNDPDMMRHELKTRG